MARVWRFGRDVNTDQIVPGRYAPYMTSDADLARSAFVEARPEFAREVRPGDLIVAGPNFGCGSSREYAAQALARNELGAVIAPSFARIFYRNALNLGLPLFEADLPELEDGEEVELVLDAPAVRRGALTLPLPEPSDFVRAVWAAGGILAYHRAEGRIGPGALA